MATFVMMSRCAGISALRNVLGRRICTSVCSRNLTTRGIQRLDSVTPVIRNSAAFALRRYVADAAAAPTSSSTGVQRRRPRFGQEEAVAGAENTVDGLLSIMDDQARRWGRVDQEQVQQVLDLMSNAGKGSTSVQQAVMLVRCTGALLVKETPVDRIKICHKVCTAIEASGLVFNIQMYNALLRVMIENGQTFSPAEVLNDMEVKKQLIPNRVTYQLLLSQFCELGDVEGASKILEHMKKQNLTINETIFNALVKGHVRKGDIAGAETVMTSMREAGLDPTADTYTVLMSGLAETGNLQGIKKTLSDARKDDVIVTPRHLYSVILTLASKGHVQHVNSMLEYVQSQSDTRYNQDALNCMFQLIAGGHDAEAFNVYMSMDRSGYIGQESKLGNVLLRCMVIKGRPVDSVIETWKKLRAEKLSNESLEEVGNWAFRYQHADYVLQVLDKMKALGFAIKQHYFWPVLTDAAKRGDVDAVVGTVRRLIDCSSEEDSVVGTVFRWGVKELLDAGQKLETVLPKLKEVGLSDTDLQIIQVSSLVSQGQLAEAAKLIEAGTKFSPGILKAELVSGFFRSRLNVEDTVKLLQMASKKFSKNALVDVNSGVLLALLKRHDIQASTLEQLLPAWTKADLKIYKNFQAPITSDLTARNVPKELIEQLQPLFTDEVRGTRTPVEQVSVEELRSAPVEQLEAWLENAKKTRYGQSKMLEKYLLAKYCSEGAVEKADALKASMDATGFVYAADTLQRLGNLAAKHKNNLDEALDYMKQIESQYPTYKTYAVLTLNVAQLQFANGKFADAMATLKEYARKNGDQLHESGFSEGYQFSELGSQVVEACAKHNSLPQTLELVDVLFDSGYIKAGTYSILDEVIEGFAKKDDVDGIIAALQHCVTKFNKAPNFSQIFRLLIVKEDADRLQKAVDLVTTVHGEMNVLLRLSACFVECGKVKQARKILETPGLRALMRPLVDSCEHFLRTDKVKELEQFVDITKNLFAVDRGEMLLQLMRLHAKRKDTAKMMEVFSLFEEEGILAKPHILRYVAKVLEGQKQPVPFEVPPPLPEREDRRKPQQSARVEADKKTVRATERSTESQQSLPAAEQQALQKAIDSTDVSDLLELKAKAAESGTDAGVGFTLRVVKELVRRHEFKNLRNFLHGLATTGDIDSLNAVKALNMQPLANFILQSLFRAHIYGNKAGDLIDYLKKNSDELPRYLSTGAFYLLSEKQPELFKNLEDLSLEHFERTNSRAVVNHVYKYYMMNEQFDKANNLLQKHIAAKDVLELRSVCQQAKRLKKENIIRQVIDQQRGGENLRRLAFPYNYLLLMKCEEGDWSSALKCYNAALADGLTFDDLWVRSLQALQAVAITNKQPVPWQAGMLEKKSAAEAFRPRRQPQRGNVDNAASSSDSSDSDAEKVDKKANKKPTQ